MTLTFKPDWVSPPGETIADLLEEKDWTQAQLAVKLAKVLGGTENFWLNREANYRSQQQNIA